MIVRELGIYLAEQKQASCQELALTFRTRESAIEAMMQIWLKKGRVRYHGVAACGGCCGKQRPAYYEWLDEGQIAITTS